MTPTASTARADIVAERMRQQSHEGFTPSEDDQYVRGELELAALTYIHQAETHFRLPEAAYRATKSGALWPWAESRWRPHSVRHDLVRAGALLLAELDRRFRAGQTDGCLLLADAIDRVVVRIDRFEYGGPPIPWTSPHECLLLLVLAGPVDLTEADVAAWTQGQREEAADWSAKVYAVGGDLAAAPPMPAYVRMKTPDESRVICANCGHVGPNPPAPALSCCPERRPVPIDSDAGRVAAYTFEPAAVDLVGELRLGMTRLAAIKAKAEAQRRHRLPL
ncbi:hypothetical protein [Azospirillum picis]|uniref:Uncharacterized protein n=1 Tax=Azospirillum picis TaxID=488438 RepID=A0ABU0MVD7_9PROT|nr:hypothetical protein [Azospirillum picis]MBP2303311.1 hypothetical protein [Azospirillum picis]MDQ0537149.1 hypothetical protein [Azospirillum picis]